MEERIFLSLSGYCWLLLLLLSAVFPPVCGVLIKITEIQVNPIMSDMSPLKTEKILSQ